MLRIVVVAGLAVFLTGCAGMGRTLSYGTELADAHSVIEGREYRFYVHPRDETFIMQRSIATAAAQGLVTGLTWGIASPGYAHDPWKRAAEAFVAPVGCQVGDVYMLGRDSGTWEAKYACPAGVDLRALVSAQRSALRRGQTLQVPTAQAPQAARPQPIAPPAAPGPAPPAARPLATPAPPAPNRNCGIRSVTNPNAITC